jgi:hypothetical protein
MAPLCGKVVKEMVSWDAALACVDVMVAHLCSLQRQAQFTLEDIFHIFFTEVQAGRAGSWFLTDTHTMSQYQDKGRGDGFFLLTLLQEYPTIPLLKPSQRTRIDPNPSLIARRQPMRDFSLDTLGVSLGLFLRKIRRYFRLDSPWDKADDSLPPAAPTAGNPPEEVQVRAAEPLPTIADSEKGLWVDCSYCWVVVCKNHWFHRRRNLFNVHRIPLAETDAVSSRPTINRPFRARCDECRKEYMFKPSEVLRWEMEPPPSFVPHRLFRE